ncbi:MAG: hypothetical protein PUC37_07850 [Spirochaetales bacterium]|nr:hypothetical protein [Spirochaetales bacterium]
MKKISIILSTVVAVAVLALASCSNVTELNGSEFDVYNADFSKAADAVTKANAKKVKIQVSDGASVALKHDDSQSYKTVYFEHTDVVPETITLELSAALGDTGIEKETKKLNFNVGSLTATYKNAKVDAYASSITFKITDDSSAKGEKFTDAGVNKGQTISVSVASAS